MKAVGSARCGSRLSCWRKAWSHELEMLMADRERLRLSNETWVETVLNFGRWFRLAAGRVDGLAAEAARRGRRWLQGVSHSRTAFA